MVHAGTLLTCGPRYSPRLIEGAVGALLTLAASSVELIVDTGIPYYMPARQKTLMYRTSKIEIG